ncbi:hypothetical protein JCM24511_01255 [Saitozyma sp. JCM 24511]|nr:hypothetical protein JCM24511_01255 [Saitozyma sp. JCM 24511]
MQGHSLYDPFLTNPYGFAPIDEGVSGSALPNGDLHDYSQYTHADYSMADGVDGVDGELDGDEESDEAETADNLRSQSGSADSTKPKGSKKPRITLARGGACVACRNRKLKCTGDKPCKTCKKANIDCRYEEIQRKKPRAVLLEERVAELEALLIMRGEAIPPSALAPASGPASHSSLSLASPLKESPVPAQLASLSLQAELAPTATMNASPAEIAPNSPLEHALINVVLPYTPHLLIPVHPQRLLALITLPPTDPRRPHPALLYILFAEAVRILENHKPSPRLPRAPASLFPQNFSPPMPSTTTEPSYILTHVQGASLSLLERARTELDHGIRNVDRPFDLVRAAIGISRYLYSLGRFVEGWNIPVARLLVSCGLHRMTGSIVRPDNAPVEFIPPPYPPAHAYAQPLAATPYPVLRMRPVIVPPARDEIEMAERNLTFWAAKSSDWAAGLGWGWTTGMADDECTTEWPWGWGSAEIKPGDSRWGIQDLYDASSPMHSSPFPDTTFTLATKSTGLVHRASHLFDLPEASVLRPDGRPTNVPSLTAVQAVQSALELFRKRIPAAFADPPGSAYDGLADPWWILLHLNLYTAEMLMWKEMAHHRSKGYETAVSCARAIVGLVQRMRADSWIHLDLVAALDISLASRFLFKESDRLAKAGQSQAAAMAGDEAETLRVALARDLAKWLPMASLHAIIVQRVREGWPEKEGEYERV